MNTKNLKKNLLFLNYLEGIPNPNIGGPNHVIYDFIANYDGSDYEFDFLSYGAYIPKVNLNSLAEENRYFLGSKKFTGGLYYKNKFFRSLVSSDFYKPFHFWKHNHYFEKKIPKKEYNVIHAHDSVGLSFTKAMKNCKRIMTIHHYIPYSLDMTTPIKNRLIKNKVHELLREKESLSLEISDVITFPSHAVKNFFFEKLKPQKEKDVRIIYNGVDLNKIKSIPPYNLKRILLHTEQNYDWVIISVSSHEKYKNLDIALKTIARIVHGYKKRVMFINCGVGSQTDELKSLSAKLGIENNVLFLGSVPNNEVIALMKASDVFLHLSDKVVFDLVVLEAMACGLCVVAMDRGGNKEIIINEENGLLINDLDEDTAAQSIITQNHETIRKSALCAIKNFSLQNYVSAYNKLYSDLC